MHLSWALVTAVLAVGAMGQQTRCDQLDSGFGYICSPNGAEVRYCQPDQSPRRVTSQFCRAGDCRANGSQGFCENGISRMNRNRGPTSCRQVNADGGYTCSRDYKTLYKCRGFNRDVADRCGPGGGCFASTTGDQGKCIR